MKRILGAVAAFVLMGFVVAPAHALLEFETALTTAGTDISAKLVLVGIAALALLALALGWSLAMKWIGKAARQG